MEAGKVNSVIRYKELYRTGDMSGQRPSIADIRANTLAMSVTGNILVSSERRSGADNPLNKANADPEINCH